MKVLPPDYASVLGHLSHELLLVGKPKGAVFLLNVQELRYIRDAAASRDGSPQTDWRPYT